MALVVLSKCLFRIDSKPTQITEGTLKHRCFCADVHWRTLCRIRQFPRMWKNATLAVFSLHGPLTPPIRENCGWCLYWECRERFPATDMHDGTCVTHVPWCMQESLTSGFLWSMWRGQCSRHSRRIQNRQFSVSVKSPMPVTMLVEQNSQTLRKWLRWFVIGYNLGCKFINSTTSISYTAITWTTCYLYIN